MTGPKKVFEIIFEDVLMIHEKVFEDTREDVIMTSKISSCDDLKMLS